MIYEMYLVREDSLYKTIYGRGDIICSRFVYLFLDQSPEFVLLQFSKYPFEGAKLFGLHYWSYYLPLYWTSPDPEFQSLYDYYEEDLDLIGENEMDEVAGSIHFQLGAILKGIFFEDHIQKIPDKRIYVKVSVS